VRTFASLRRRGDFARVRSRGRRRAGTYFVAFVDTGRDPRRSRIGLSIAKDVGGAVIRNRVRRRLKAVLDGTAFGQTPFVDCVLIARPAAGTGTFAEIAAEVSRLLSLG